MNDLVREVDPSVLRQNLHQLLLDLLRRVALGQLQAPRNAEDMRVDHHAFCLAEADAQDYVGRFACSTGQRDKLGQRLGNLALEIGDQLLCRTLY